MCFFRRIRGGRPWQLLDAGALRETTETGRNAAPGLEAAETVSAMRMESEAF